MFLLSCCHSVSVRISTVAFKNMGRRALNSTLIFLAFPYAVLSYVPPKAYALLATSAPPRDSLARGRHQAAEVAQGQESAAPASSSGHSAGSSASGFGVGSSRASGSGFLNAQLARAGEAARAGLPSGSRESMRSDAKSLVDGTMKHMKALNEVHARIFFKEREVGGGVGVLPGGAALTTTKKGRLQDANVMPPLLDSSGEQAAHAGKDFGERSCHRCGGGRGTGRCASSRCACIISIWPCLCVDRPRAPPRRVADWVKPLLVGVAPRGLRRGIRCGVVRGAGASGDGECVGQPGGAAPRWLMARARAVPVVPYSRLLAL